MDFFPQNNKWVGDQALQCASTARGEHTPVLGWVLDSGYGENRSIPHLFCHSSICFFVFFLSIGFRATGSIHLYWHFSEEVIKLIKGD